MANLLGKFEMTPQEADRFKSLSRKDLRRLASEYSKSHGPFRMEDLLSWIMDHPEKWPSTPSKALPKEVSAGPERGKKGKRLPASGNGFATLQIAKRRPTVPLTIPGCQLSRVGLTIQRDLPFKEWQHIGGVLHSVEGSVLWWIGDWLNYGELRWKETYAEGANATGLAIQTLRIAKMVAKAFDVFRRRNALTFSHHAEVASLHPNEQDEYLDLAEKNGWTRNQLRQHLNGNGQAKKFDGVKVLGHLRDFVFRLAKQWPPNLLDDFASELKCLAEEVVKPPKSGGPRVTSGRPDAADAS